MSTLQTQIQQTQQGDYHVVELMRALMTAAHANDNSVCEQ